MMLIIMVTGQLLCYDFAHDICQALLGKLLKTSVGYLIQFSVLLYKMTRESEQHLRNQISPLEW